MQLFSPLNQASDPDSRFNLIEQWQSDLNQIVRPGATSISFNMNKAYKKRVKNSFKVATGVNRQLSLENYIETQLKDTPLGLQDHS